MSIPLKELEAKARDVGRLIGKAIDEEGQKKVGFCLLLFDFGGSGNITYLSNAQREDMIKAMKEFLYNFEGGHVPPLGGNAG